MSTKLVSGSPVHFGGSRAILVAGLPAKTGKGPSGLEMPWYIIFHIKNEYQTCFGVTSPFRGLAGNLGAWIAREDRKRSDRLGNALVYNFLYKK